MSIAKHATVYIEGMHCVACEIFICNTFKEFKNVQKVTADHVGQVAHLTYTGTIDKEKMNKLISTYGYKVVDKHDEAVEGSYSKKLYEVAIVSVILALFYFFANEFDLISTSTFSSKVSLVGAFVFGLIVSSSTCIATSASLLKSVMKSETKAKDSKFNTQKYFPVILFIVGRVFAYGLFGFITGWIGKIIVENLQLGVYLSVFSAVLFVIIGLDMLKLVRISALAHGSFKQRLFKIIEAKIAKYPQKTAFILGAITYLLPCGFTQSIQVYALNVANPVQSAFIMAAFALGTVPMLLKTEYVPRFNHWVHYQTFMKVIGVAILLFGVYYLANFLAAFGIHI